jgi:protein involved in polysaccharide export with SLBB domain
MKFKYSNTRTSLYIFIQLVIIIGYGDLSAQTTNTNLIIGDPEVENFPFKPGDGVAISTFPDTASFLNNTFSIDDRGFVEFPIVGKVKITGMSREDLITFLKDKFKGWLRNPNIYVKPVIRISILGGFQRPGLYYVDYNSSLWEIVRIVGGPLRDDGIYEMKWEREGDSCDGDIVKFYENGTSLKKMGIRSGDQILTPMPDRRTFWNMVAEVMPILTFATSVVVMYQTYQRDQLLFQLR